MEILLYIIAIHILTALISLVLIANSCLFSDENEVFIVISGVTIFLILNIIFISVFGGYMFKNEIVMLAFSEKINACDSYEIRSDEVLITTTKEGKAITERFVYKIDYDKHEIQYDKHVRQLESPDSKD